MPDHERTPPERRARAHGCAAGCFGALALIGASWSPRSIGTALSLRLGTERASTSSCASSSREAAARSRSTAPRARSLDTVRIRRITWRGPDTQRERVRRRAHLDADRALVPRHRRARTGRAAPHARNERGDRRRSSAGEPRAADRRQHRASRRRADRLARRHESAARSAASRSATREAPAGIGSPASRSSRRWARSPAMRRWPPARRSPSRGSWKAKGDAALAGIDADIALAGLALGADARRHRQCAGAATLKGRVSLAPLAAAALRDVTFDASGIDLAAVESGAAGNRSHARRARAARGRRARGHDRRRRMRRPAASMPVGCRLRSFAARFTWRDDALAIDSIAATHDGGGTIAGQGTIPLGAAGAAGSWTLDAARHRPAPDLCAAARDAPFREGRCRSRSRRAANPRQTSPIARSPAESRWISARSSPTETVIVERFRARSGKGELAGRGRVALEGDARVRARRDRARFDPAAYGAFPAGALDGKIAAKGMLAPAWRVQADVALAPRQPAVGRRLSKARRAAPSRAMGFAMRRSTSRPAARSSRRPAAPSYAADHATITLDAPNLAELAPLLPKPSAHPIEGALSREGDARRTAAARRHRARRQRHRAQAAGRHVDRRSSRCTRAVAAGSTADFRRDLATRRVELDVTASRIVTPEGSFATLRAGVTGTAAAACGHACAQGRGHRRPRVRPRRARRSARRGGRDHDGGARVEGNARYAGEPGAVDAAPRGARRRRGRTRASSRRRDAPRHRGRQRATDRFRVGRRQDHDVRQLQGGAARHARAARGHDVAVPVDGHARRRMVARGDAAPLRHARGATRGRRPRVRPDRDRGCDDRRGHRDARGASRDSSTTRSTRPHRSVRAAATRPRRSSPSAPSRALLRGASRRDAPLDFSASGDIPSLAVPAALDRQHGRRLGARASRRRGARHRRARPRFPARSSARACASTRRNTVFISRTVVSPRTRRTIASSSTT